MEKKLSKSELINKYSLFVFDLDDTLYKESDYLFKGYRAIADYLVEKGYGSTANEYYEYLINEYKERGRKKLFDRFLSHYCIPVEMNVLLDILHNQKVNIVLEKKASDFLDLLVEQKKTIYILTNGNIQQQKNKVRLLRLEEFYPQIKIVYASALEPKPSPLSLFLIMEQENKKAKDMVFIGDSAVDELTANNANVDFIYIQNIKQ